MKAGILAGGKGTRLKKLIPDIPKSMIEIGNIPLIHRTIKILSEAGANQIVIVVPKNNKSIKQSFKHFHKKNISLLFIEGKGISTIIDFFLLQDYISISPFFVLMGDILFLKQDFLEFKVYCVEKVDTIVTGVTKFVTSQNSVSILYKNGHILDMGRGLKDKNLVSAGIHYFPLTVFKWKNMYLNSGGTSITGFMRFLMQKGYGIYPFFFHTVIDINRPYEYHLALKYSQTFLDDV